MLDLINEPSAEEVAQDLERRKIARINELKLNINKVLGDTDFIHNSEFQTVEEKAATLLERATQYATYETIKASINACTTVGELNSIDLTII